VEIVVQAPATAALRIGAPGYADEERSLYMDTEVFGYCRNMNELYPSFYSPSKPQATREPSFRRGMLKQGQVLVSAAGLPAHGRTRRSADGADVVLLPARKMGASAPASRLTRRANRVTHSGAVILADRRTTEEAGKP